MNRFRLLVLLVAPIAALVAASAFGASGIAQTGYKVTFSGTQITNWSYAHTETRIDCTTDYHGRGSQRYEFDSTRKAGAVVNVIRGKPLLEQVGNALRINKEIDGSAEYVNGGAQHCPQTTYAVNKSGCGISHHPGAFLLSLKPHGQIQVFLQETNQFAQCPSAANGSHDEAGGHALETISGHVNLTSLLKARTTGIHAQKTIRRDIKYGTQKIGEETTTISWSLHFARLR